MASACIRVVKHTACSNNKDDRLDHARPRHKTPFSRLAHMRAGAREKSLENLTPGEMSS